MTIEIPTWLLWTLGAVIGAPPAAALVACAIIGGRVIYELWMM